MDGNNTRRRFFASLTAVAGALWGLPKLKASASGPQMKHKLAPPIVHNGLIYISGQGANDGGPVESNTIEAHTRKVMENIKEIVEAGGGTMDSILQLNVYLANLDDYQGMNKVYYSYFPNRRPARCTVSVAGVPGHSLLEINGVAAVVK